MNPLQRKAKTVEMTKSTDHRDVSGGLGRRLWRPRLLPYAALVAVVAAVPVATGSAAGSSLPKPGGLKTFIKRLGEPRKLCGRRRAAVLAHAVVRVAPVRGATRYEFELSTSKRFRADNGVIWSSKTLTTPGRGRSDLASVDHRPVAVLARSCARQPRRLAVERHRPLQHALDGSGVPEQLPSEPGFVSWKPIEGATGYDVWFGNLGSEMRDGVGVTVGKIVSTITTVADEREYSTLRAPGNVVQWRVRARRALYGVDEEWASRVSRTGHGARSTPRRRVASGEATRVATAAVGRSRSARRRTGARPHAGVRLLAATATSSTASIVATDEDCVNVVHVGSIVGGTAYAPGRPDRSRSLRRSGR